MATLTQKWDNFKTCLRKLREKHMVFYTVLREIHHDILPKLRETQGTFKKKSCPNPDPLFPDLGRSAWRLEHFHEFYL